MVELILGKKEKISYSDTETSYGGSETLVEAFGRNASFDPNVDTQNWTALKTAGTNDLDVPAREKGQEQWGGVLSYVPQNWQFLKFVLCGADTEVTDTDSGTYYTHTFTNTEDNLLSFNLERAKQASTSSVVTYVGCQVNQYSLAWDSSDVGSFITATANIMAQDASEGSSVTGTTPPSTEGFKPRHVQLTLEDTAVAYLRSGTFTINNTLTDGFYSEYSVDRKKKESVPQLRTYNLSAVAQYEDDTFFHMFDSADVLSSTNTLELKRGTNDNLTATFTGGYLNNAPDPTNLDGANTVSLNIDINSVAFVAKDQLSDYRTFA